MFRELCCEGTSARLCAVRESDLGSGLGLKNQEALEVGWKPGL